MGRFGITLMGCLACALLAGCATYSVAFQSQPSGADVYVRRLGSTEKPQSLGQTPVTMKTQELEKRFSGPGPFEVEFRKDGYQNSQVVVTQTAAMDLTLSSNLQPSNGLDDVDRLNALMDQVFAAQRLARTGKHQEALDRLRAIEKEAPQLSVAYEIEGGIYYLERRYAQAFEAFTNAARYNPKSVQAIRMRQKLRGPAATMPNGPATTAPTAGKGPVAAQKSAAQIPTAPVPQTPNAQPAQKKKE